MAAFVSDTFTDTNGTSLNAHTPDVGGAWTDTPSPPTSSLADIESNHLECNAHFETNRFYNDAAQPSGDYYVEVVITQNGSHGWNNFAGVLGRVQQASGTLECYEAVWIENGSSDQWELFKWSGGSPTSLGTWADAFASGTRTVRLEMNGTAIKVFVDTVERISVTDATWSTGRAGLTIAGGLLNGLLLDNFVADVLGGGGVNVAVPVGAVAAAGREPRVAIVASNQIVIRPS